jgi:hypothetical protein
MRRRSNPAIRLCDSVPWLPPARLFPPPVDESGTSPAFPRGPPFESSPCSAPNLAAPEGFQTCVRPSRNACRSGSSARSSRRPRRSAGARFFRAGGRRIQIADRKSSCGRRNLAVCGGFPSLSSRSPSGVEGLRAATGSLPVRPGRHRPGGRVDLSTYGCGFAVPRGIPGGASGTVLGQPQDPKINVKSISYERRLICCPIVPFPRDTGHGTGACGHSGS